MGYWIPSSFESGVWRDGVDMVGCVAECDDDDKAQGGLIDDSNKRHSKVILELGIDHMVDSGVVDAKYLAEAVSPLFSKGLGQAAGREHTTEPRLGT
jgi:hypothetical protein